MACLWLTVRLAMVGLAGPGWAWLGLAEYCRTLIVGCLPVAGHCCLAMAGLGCTLQWLDLDADGWILLHKTGLLRLGLSLPRHDQAA